ncbi:glycosyltransferase [Priestia megaterium]
MKVLHYTLGLPPYRSGGLTKYSLDLMLSQIESGYNVNLLYPGQLGPLNKVKIIKNRSYKSIAVYELINPLPVSLLGGVKNPSNFMKPLREKSIYFNFLEEMQPDVIHVHTLMGIHYEFVEVAKELGIKLVFTTHDYYGICPKVNLVDNIGKICDDFSGGEKCISCNNDAYSMSMIYLMQSHLYKDLKNSKFMKRLRARKKNSIQTLHGKKAKIVEMKKGEYSLLLKKRFSDLRGYYISMLDMMDEIHFNSELAKNEYEKHIATNGKVISVTHSDIKDNRRKKYYDSKDALQIGFLGPIDEYKGFPLLRKSLLKLIDNNELNWHLHVFGNDRIINLDQDESFISFHGRYEHNNLKNIFKDIDVLVIPSVWKETFGFIGLEAISHGVPTIVTTYVGFKDLVQNHINGLIVNPDFKELAEAIKYVINNRNKLQEWNENICSNEFELIIASHKKCIEALYQK